MLVCCRELCVRQGFPVMSMVDRQHVIAVFCCDGARRWTLNYEQQGYDSQCDVRLRNSFRRRIFLLPDEHLHQDSFIAHGAKCYYFSHYWCNIFRHPSTSVTSIHLPHLQPDQRTLVIFPFVLPKTSTSGLQLKLWVVIDNILNQLQGTV